jgi:hypothetical protein
VQNKLDPINNVGLLVKQRRFTSVNAVLKILSETNLILARHTFKTINNSSACSTAFKIDRVLKLKRRRLEPVLEEL